MDVLFRTILTLFYIASISVFTLVAGEPYYGMCANPSCTEPIGFGIAVNKYIPGEYDRLRLNAKQEFVIYVKDYGEKKNLLGIQTKGERGYVPKNMVQEQRSFVKNLVPAAVEFMTTEVANLNHEASQILLSMSRQEVIHHVSPDTFSHEQNHHTNYPSESYGYHSESEWMDGGSHIYASPHVHVINSHVVATVTSQTSNVAQQPNTWESTSHIHTSPENTVVSSYSSYSTGGQTGTYQNTAPQEHLESTFTNENQQQSMHQNIAPQQQYSESTFTNENQVQSMHQNIAPQQQYSESAFTNENHQHSTHQNIAPQQQYSESTYTNENQQQSMYPNMHGYSQSVHPSEYQSPQYSNVLQSSFSPQGQNNLQYAQNSQSNQIGTSDIAGNEAQNYAYSSPQVETSHSSYAAEVHYSPDGSVSAQYSGQYLKDGESYYVSSSSSQNAKPTSWDISNTFAALKEQGFDENYIKSVLEGEVPNLNPSHMSYTGQEVLSTGYGDSSQLGYSSSETEINQNFRLQQSSIPSQAVSSKEKADYPSSPDHFYSSPQLQQSSVVSESSLQESLEVLNDEDYDEDSGEVLDDDEVEVDENDSNELPSPDIDEESDPLEFKRQEHVPSPFPQETLQSLVQKTVEQTSSFISEGDTVSPSPSISPETISESKISEDHQQSTAYPGSSQSDVIEDIQEKTLDNVFANENFKESSISDNITASNSSPNNTAEEKIEAVDVLDIAADPSVVDNSGIFFDNIEDMILPENVNETDTSFDKDQNDNLEKILNISEFGDSEQSGYLNAYQIRNLKGEQENKDNQNSDTFDDVGGNTSSPEYDFYDYIENTVGAIRSFVEVLLMWIPEPLYSTIMELESKGISPRVPVFTALSAIPCLFLIIALVYVKERSKEQKLIAQLAFAEKNVYTLSAEKSVLEEKLEKVEAELESCKATLKSERKFYDDLKAEVVNLNRELEKSNLELEKRMDQIETLKEQEKGFTKLLADNEKIHLELIEEKNQLNNQLSCQDETICQFKDQLQEKGKEIKELQDEKIQYSKANEVYEEKLTQLQQNCNQLLKEAEIWNLRVNELNTKLTEETQSKQQLEESLSARDIEIESLTYLVESFKSFDELEDPDSDEYKSNKEKLKCLLKSANISIILQRQEEENKLIMEKLSEEKAKILDMEVELLEAKSEIDKLKLSYNQALQDKTEAQTKLEVLTNYFKDKEIQLQKQLGAQEVFREKREKDADSAERRIVLIEQENASYKSQVASMKQEMEETERNLKSQIAAQEKKAHENWIAARASERKLEDMKQEVTQLRQKLTLLERDQGNFINASRDDIIRPIPQRIAGVNDDTINSQDINNSMDEPPGMYRMPLPPMMLPDMPRDRPLPPLPLPPPPFEPPPMFAPPPFVPFPRDPMFNSEFRVTPPEFSRGRASTPPRGRQSAINDSDMGPRQSSPLGGELRESRNSTPPHSLPDFHDIPPPPRPFYPPHRFPFRPPFRREFAQGPPRPDYQGENSQSRGTQPSSGPQDGWTPSNSRV